MESTLVLNASYEPLGIVSARSAINKILANKAVAIDNSEKIFHHADDNGSPVYVPYVVLMTYMVNPKHSFGPKSFSRRGILARDKFTCAYCGKPGTTIDHVLPRALGGQNSYENCVTACLSCNSKKASKTLEQLGWSLPFKPEAPSRYESFLFKASGEPLKKAWATYIDPWSKVKVK